MYSVAHLSAFGGVVYNQDGRGEDGELDVSTLLYYT